MRETLQAFHTHYRTLTHQAKHDGLRPRFVYHRGGAEFTVARLKLVEDRFIAVVVAELSQGYFLLPYFPELEVQLVHIEGDTEPPRIGFEFPSGG